LRVNIYIKANHQTISKPNIHKTSAIGHQQTRIWFIAISSTNLRAKQTNLRAKQSKQNQFERNIPIDPNNVAKQGD